jgi:flagellar hook assembly protein FlgD
MLRAVAPNPFQSRTTLAYDLARRDPVDLRIYDVSGRLVRTLIAGDVEEAGPHVIEWDGRSDAGATSLSGLYFGRLVTGGDSDVRRLVRIR